MPSSESLPNLHDSIEQLIANAVEQARATSTAQAAACRAAIEETLIELEAQQAALARSIERLRAALAVEAASADDSAASAPAPASAETETDDIPTNTPTPIAAARELDVIAHGASLAHAAGLQQLLRALPSVDAVQTRQFVNGELRLQTVVRGAVDREGLTTWLAANGGDLLTVSDSVVEIVFN